MSIPDNPGRLLHRPATAQRQPEQRGHVQVPHHQQDLRRPGQPRGLQEGTSRQPARLQTLRVTIRCAAQIFSSLARSMLIKFGHQFTYLQKCLEILRKGS